MDKKIKAFKIFKVFLLCSISALFLASCGSEKEGAQTGQSGGTSQTENASPSGAEASEEVSIVSNESKFPEIPIDYPFRYGMEGYTLTLVPEESVDKSMDSESGESAAGGYEVRFCDEKGTVIQQFPCGRVGENPRFSCDDLIDDTYNDLQIFPSDEDGGYSHGLLFVYDWQEHKFSEDALEIPVYDECRNGNMLISEENEDSITQSIYQISRYNGKCILLRQWRRQKTSGLLTIKDCLAGKNIFEGETTLNEDGTLANDKYYQNLFWQNLSYLLDSSVYPKEDSAIRMFIDGEDYTKSAQDPNLKGFENVRKEAFGDDNLAEYPDRQTLLEDFGVWGTKAFYEYYDALGNLQLELYFDPATEKGCGIRHKYYYTDASEKLETLYGFAFNSTYPMKWEEEDAFSTKSYEGTDGADSVKDYEEQMEYRQDGKPDSFYSQGIVDWLSEAEEPMMVLSIDWVYRDDGSLYYRNYNHNSYIFGTSCLYIRGYYDKAGRTLFERSYITHGSIEDYYIYTDDGKKPTYCLNLDDNLGYYLPVMIKYE
ncbi:MAG: hypothetical protein NC094_00210 [Bacteroidales bacterium]|nr:hypothetical protein [Lachnoclostridium sp.]MCM1384646.1 hypothetical protein [Lachnoclostridium sp.]MCM1463815.1 hypothetical protein [Bacteroidales bacterium]